MTTQTVQLEADAKRFAQIASLRDFADWLDAHPDAPMPSLSLHRHLHDLDGTEAENLDAVQNLAASLGVGTDEHLDDRTVLRVKVGEHVWYELFAWHKNGRGGIGELERLRARIAELEAAPASDRVRKPIISDETIADAARVAGSWNEREQRWDNADDADTGLTYSREADDPTPVSPARVPLHTGFHEATVTGCE